MIVPLAPIGKYGDRSTDRSSALSRTKSQCSVLLASHFWNASRLSPTWQERANLEKDCSAVLMLLTSAKKMPQKLDEISSCQARSTDMLTRSTDGAYSVRRGCMDNTHTFLDGLGQI